MGTLGCMLVVVCGRAQLNVPLSLSLSARSEKSDIAKSHANDMKECLRQLEHTPHSTSMPLGSIASFYVECE